MADAYFTIAQIANDTTMQERMNAATTQQKHLGAVPAIPTDPVYWVTFNRYLWASSPGWGAAWDSALAAHPPDSEPDYEPGADAAVITDGMILATVQQLGGTPPAAQADESEDES